MINRHYFFVSLAGILSGLVIFGGKIFADFGLSLIELATLPYFLAIFVLGPFVMLNKKLRWTKKMMPILMLYGLVSIFIVLTQFGAVLLNVPVATIVLLLYTQPLWTILITRIFFKEKITKYSIIACIIVLLGVLFLVNPLDMIHTNWIGILVALAGGISLSGWVIVGSCASKQKIPPITSKFSETLFMILGLAILFPVLSIFIKNPVVTSFSLSWPLKVWIYLILFNLIAQILNHLSYLEGVKKVPTSNAGIILLLEPVSAAVLAALFLHQPITLNVVIGGILILIANYLVIKKG